MKSLKQNLRLVSNFGKHITQLMRESEILLVVQRLKLDLGLALTDEKQISERMVAELKKNIANPPCKVNSHDFELVKLYKELYNTVHYLEQSLESLLNNKDLVLQMREIYKLLKQISKIQDFVSQAHGVLFAKIQPSTKELFDIQQHILAILSSYIQNQNWVDTAKLGVAETVSETVTPNLKPKAKINYAFVANLIVRLNTGMQYVANFMQENDLEQVPGHFKYKAHEIAEVLNQIASESSFSAVASLPHKLLQQFQDILTSIITVSKGGQQNLLRKINDLKQHLFPILISEAESVEENLGLKSGFLAESLNKTFDNFYNTAIDKISKLEKINVVSKKIDENPFKKIAFGILGIRNATKTNILQEKLQETGLSQKKFTQQEFNKNLNKLRYLRQQDILEVRTKLITQLDAIENFNNLLISYSKQNFELYSDLDVLTQEQRDSLNQHWQEFADMFRAENEDLYQQVNKILNTPYKSAGWMWRLMLAVGQFAGGASTVSASFQDSPSQKIINTLQTINQKIKAKYDLNEQKYLFFQDTLHLHNMTIADLEPTDHILENIKRQDSEEEFAPHDDDFKEEYSNWFQKFKNFVDYEMEDFIKKYWAKEITEKIFKADGTLSIPCVLDKNEPEVIEKVKRYINIIHQIKELGVSGWQDKLKIVKLIIALEKTKTTIFFKPSVTSILDKLNSWAKDLLPSKEPELMAPRIGDILKKELLKLNYQLFALESKSFDANARPLIEEYIKKSSLIKKVLDELGITQQDLIDDLQAKIIGKEKLQVCRDIRLFINHLATQVSKVSQENLRVSQQKPTIFEQLEKLQNQIALNTRYKTYDVMRLKKLKQSFENFKNILKEFNNIRKLPSHFTEILQGIEQILLILNQAAGNITELVEEKILQEILKLRHAFLYSTATLSLNLGLKTDLITANMKAEFDIFANDIMESLNFDILRRDQYKYSDLELYENLFKEFEPLGIKSDHAYREDFMFLKNKMKGCLERLKNFQGTLEEKNNIEMDFITAFDEVYEACSSYGVFNKFDKLRKYINAKQRNLADFEFLYAKVSQSEKTIEEIFIKNKKNDITKNQLIIGMEEAFAKEIESLKQQKPQQIRIIIQHIFDRSLEAKFGPFAKFIKNNCQITLNHILDSVVSQIGNKSIKGIIANQKPIVESIQAAIAKMYAEKEKYIWIAKESYIIYQSNKKHFLDEIEKYNKNPAILAQKELAIDSYLEKIYDSILEYNVFAYSEQKESKSNNQKITAIRQEKNNIESYWLSQEEELITVLTEIDRMHDIKIAIEKWRENNGVGKIVNANEADKKMYITLENMGKNILDYIERVRPDVDKRMITKIHDYIENNLDTVKKQDCSITLKESAIKGLNKVSHISDLTKVKLPKGKYLEHMAAIKSDIRALHNKKI